MARNSGAIAVANGKGEGRLGYYMLVATIFTGCLPVTLARSVSGRRDTRSIPYAGPFAAALETAQCTAAQVYSLPG